jgi:hypothetical protein
MHKCFIVFIIQTYTRFEVLFEKGYVLSHCETNRYAE